MVWDTVCGCHCTMCNCIWWVCSTYCMYVCFIEYTVLASVCVSHGRVGSWHIETEHIQPSTMCKLHCCQSGSPLWCCWSPTHPTSCEVAMNGHMHIMWLSRDDCSYYTRSASFNHTHTCTTLINCITHLRIINVLQKLLRTPACVAPTATTTIYAVYSVYWISLYWYVSDLLASLGADCTRELLLRVVGWTGDAITVGLHVVEESTVNVASAPRDGLSIFVHTLKCVPVVSVNLCHDVATVLQSPHWGTVIPRWYKKDLWPASHTADCAENIVVVNIGRRRCFIYCVLWPMQWAIALHSWLISTIFGHQWQTVCWIHLSFDCVDSLLQSPRRPVLSLAH